MAKDPSFPFYAQDYLVDTIQWSRDMKSLHIDLLAVAWINGQIDADANGNPVNFSSEDVVLFSKIRHKWNLKEGKLINERLELAREDRRKFREKQSERGKKSAEARYNSNHGSTTVQPSVPVEPLEKEKENEDSLIKEDKPKRKGLDLGFVSSDFVEIFQRWLAYKKDRGESYKNEDSLKQCYNKLLKLAGNNPDNAIELVQDSMANNYSGLFPLKKKNNQPETKKYQKLP